MDVRHFHTARRCNSAMLPISDERFSLLLQFRIQLIRCEPTDRFNVLGTYCTGDGILHDEYGRFHLEPWTDAEWDGYIRNFRRIIMNFWDGAFRLIPSEPWFTSGSRRIAAEIDCGLSIEVVQANPHHRYYIIKPREETFRSFASPERRIAMLTHLDLSGAWSTSRVRVGRQRHNVDFYQCPALHEFGHTLGLEHIAGNGNSDAAYGTRLESRHDIMGGGDWLSERNARPWIRRLERHLVRPTDHHRHPEYNVRFSAIRTRMQLITYWDYDWTPPSPPPPPAPPRHAVRRHR